MSTRIVLSGKRSAFSLLPTPSARAALQSGCRTVTRRRPRHLARNSDPHLTGSLSVPGTSSMSLGPGTSLTMVIAADWGYRPPLRGFRQMVLPLPRSTNSQPVASSSRRCSSLPLRAAPLTHARSPSHSARPLVCSPRSQAPVAQTREGTARDAASIRMKSQMAATEFPAPPGYTSTSRRTSS